MIDDAINIVLIVIIGASLGVVGWCVWDWYINRSKS